MLLLQQKSRVDQTAFVVVAASSAAPLEALVSLCYTGTANVSKSLLPEVIKVRIQR